MLKHRNEQIQLAVRTTDACVCVLAFYLAYWLRSHILVDHYGGIGPIDSQIWMLGASLVIHILLFPSLHFYESLRRKSVFQIVTMVVRAWVIEFFILGALVFFYQAKTTSRIFFVLFLACSYAMILGEKLGARALLSAIRRRGYNYRQILIVGTGKNAARIAQIFRLNKHWGYVPCGLVRESQAPEAKAMIQDLPILGDLVSLESILTSRAVDEVYFAADYLDSQELERPIQICEKLGIAARFSMGVFNLSHSKLTFSYLGEVPIVTFYTTLMTPIESAVKRLMDILISIVGLLITGVLLPWIAYRIRKEGPGPVLFKQVRVGENGRRFKCYKFRTMVADADRRKLELLQSNQMQGPIFKVDDDPRVTRFGAFLRRTSLDELPQFLNILRGDMSVVGTRPPTPDEVSQYEIHYRRRLSVRPGLTGLWQVSGRNEIRNFEEILALDLQYIDHWSLGLDVQIILRTIGVILFRKGAY